MNLPNPVVGTITSIVSLIVCVIIIVLHRWTKKIAKYYWFWAIISVAYILYLLFAAGWFEEYSTMASGKIWTLDYDGQQNNLSNVFCTHICHFCAFTVPVCLLIDPSRKAARAFSPISFLGSFAVIFISFPAGQSNPELSPQWFFGSYYLYHLFNLLIALGVFLNTPKYEWKGYIQHFIAFGIMYAWICLWSGVFGIKHHASGVNLWDFQDGDYGYVTKLLGVTPQLGQIIFFIIFPLLTFAISVIVDVTKRGWYKYGNYSTKNWIVWYNYNRYTKNKFFW